MSEIDLNQVPKDLVMFSSKARQEITKNLDKEYLQVNYDIQIPDYENDPKYRVWGLKWYGMTHPFVSGTLGGIFFGTVTNFIQKRKPLASVSMYAGHKLLDSYNLKNEMMIWDYVKRHPEDFPEVFQEPKKYKDVLKPWRPNRI